MRANHKKQTHRRDLLQCLISDGTLERVETRDSKTGHVLTTEHHHASEQIREEIDPTFLKLPADPTS